MDPDVNTIQSQMRAVKVVWKCSVVRTMRKSLLPKQLLEQLLALGIPCVIASSGSSQRVDLGITTTGLVEFFPDDVITTRDHVERGKPFPDLFLLAAERAGIDPARCLVIEDSPHGVDAAHRAGMRVVGLSFRTPVARLTGADWIVTDAADILPLILVP